MMNVARRVLPIVFGEFVVRGVDDIVNLLCGELSLHGNMEVYVLDETLKQIDF